MPLKQSPRLPEQMRLGLVNAQANDFAEVFRHILGDCAREHGHQFLAEYKYSESYSRWAVNVGNAPDDVEVVGEGLELLISPIPQDLGSDRRVYNYRWRVKVKDHSTSQSLIFPVYQLVKTKLFPFSECVPVTFDNELDLQQAVWRIDRPEVPKIRSGKVSLF